MGSTTEIVRIDGEIAELVPAYLDSLRSGLAEARAWLKAGDFTRLGRQGHGWKGSGESYGFAAVTRWGAELENAGRDGDAAAAGRLLDALADYLERVEIRIE